MGIKYPYGLHRGYFCPLIGLFFTHIKEASFPLFGYFVLSYFSGLFTLIPFIHRLFRTFLHYYYFRYFVLLPISGSFYDFWEERILEIKNEGTKAAYRISLNEFRKFRNDLAFNELDYNFLTSFKNWKKNTCSNNGINTYLKNIRAVYNEAVRRGVYVPDSFVSPFYKIMERAEKTQDKYLTLEEIRLIAKNPNKTKYDHYFLLCFLLGGADFIDIAKLKHSDILRGRIRFRRNKGGTNEIIDNKIFPETEEILNYFGEKEFLTDIYKFSLKTCRDNYIKRYRKQLQEQGVSSYVSSKSARYTFINIGKEQGIVGEMYTLYMKGSFQIK